MKRLLYVDEDLSMLGVISAYLLWHGYFVDGLSDSSKAAEIVSDNDYDVVIISAWSKPLSGFKVCRQIRKNDTAKGRNTSLLMVAPEDLSPDQFRQMKTQNIYFMTKYKGPEKWVGKIRTITQIENQNA